MPERIQLSRRKGWRKPEGAVVVARPSRWGNPFRVGHELWWCVEGGPVKVDVTSREGAVQLFRTWLSRPGTPSAYLGIGKPPADFSALRGRDLACWCPLDHSCHADVLLEIANTPTEEES